MMFLIECCCNISTSLEVNIMEWASILSSAGSISKNGSSHVDLISSETACVSMLYKKAQQYSTELIVTCPNAKFYVYCRPQWTINRTVQAYNVQFMMMFCIAFVCIERYPIHVILTHLLGGLRPSFPNKVGIFLTSLQRKL